MTQKETENLNRRTISRVWVLKPFPAKKRPHSTTHFKNNANPSQTFLKNEEQGTLPNESVRPAFLGPIPKPDTNTTRKRHTSIPYGY